ncbi:hypothetical protein Lsai_2682 [Legionella sainthelensi]|uniref:Uncharacterized protein n=1 Tax=Legionella sainthelensi TaxID=28087 RepID=A0A0W0YE90_9GAMM|nr:hypothetical protein [Legionella sainthelensi]KTD55090.1 hypothetical protein Lsai_2682 [Legionella sainthelensi]VEH36655.1 Uncharacterised protein [Legionella sainthelensi]
MKAKEDIFARNNATLTALMAIKKVISKHAQPPKFIKIKILEEAGLGKSPVYVVSNKIVEMQNIKGGIISSVQYLYNEDPTKDIINALPKGSEKVKIFGSEKEAQEYALTISKRHSNLSFTYGSSMDGIEGRDPVWHTPLIIKADVALNVKSDLIDNNGKISAKHLKLVSLIQPQELEEKMPTIDLQEAQNQKNMNCTIF